MNINTGVSGSGFIKLDPKEIEMDKEFAETGDQHLRYGIGFYNSAVITFQQANKPWTKSIGMSAYCENDAFVNFESAESYCDRYSPKSDKTILRAKNEEMAKMLRTKLNELFLRHCKMISQMEMDKKAKHREERKAAAP